MYPHQQVAAMHVRGTLLPYISMAAPPPYISGIQSGQGIFGAIIKGVTTAAKVAGKAAVKIGSKVGRTAIQAGAKAGKSLLKAGTSAVKGVARAGKDYLVKHGSELLGTAASEGAKELANALASGNAPSVKNVINNTLSTLNPEELAQAKQDALSSVYDAIDQTVENAEQAGVDPAKLTVQADAVKAKIASLVEQGQAKILKKLKGEGVKQKK